MQIKAEPRLVEVTSLPVFYVDDLAKVVIEGSNVRITFFEYRTFGTERVRMPVVDLIRPVASCNGKLPDMIKEAVGGEASARTH